MTIKLVVVTLVSIFTFGLVGCGGERSIPSDVIKAVFQDSDFAIPLVLTLPCEDNPREVAKLRGYQRGLPPVPALRSGGMGFSLCGEGVLDFLTEHGFVNIEKVNLPGYKNFQYTVLTYPDKIKPYIYRIAKGQEKIDYTEAEFKKCREYLGNLEIQLASRELKSVDYHNRYKEANPWESSQEVFVTRFSYILKPDFPVFEEMLQQIRQSGQWGALNDKVGKINLNKVYRGEARAHFDPAFQRWKRVYIQLEDKGQRIED